MMLLKRCKRSKHTYFLAVVALKAKRSRKAILSITANHMRLQHFCQLFIRLFKHTLCLFVELFLGYFVLFCNLLLFELYHLIQKFVL